MTAVRGLIAALGVATLALTGSAQTLSPCDAIAASLRASSDLVNEPSPGDPLRLLTAGRSPIVETVAPAQTLIGGRPDAVAGFLKTFSASFRPSAPLVAAVTNLVTSGRNDVFALRRSDLGLVVNTAGSGVCQYFVFFRSVPGREAQAVGAPFDRRQMSFCYTDGGFLAHVNGAAAFVEYTQPAIARTYALRVFPWRNGEWGHACTVTAAFDTRYEVVDVFAPDNGPLRDADIRNAAADIARRRDAAAEQPQRSFDARVSERDLAIVRGIRERSDRPQPRELPTFGHRTVQQLDASYQIIQDGELLPIVVGDRTFLLYLAHASIGWRTFPDWLMVFYALGDTAVTPVGSAIVKAQRGGVNSLRVDP
jgi:hypothetical protein